MSKSRSGAPRRIAAGLLAGALSVVGIALAPPAGATDDATGDRIAGINRYGTAAAIAGQDDFDGATVAILATGETFPDALAASGLAGGNQPSPIILTESNVYSDEARETLNNLTDITDVIIVGGTAAISQDVEDDVEADGFNVRRLAGANRYETAAEIAGDMTTVGELNGLTTALIATGTNFADALAGGPVAYDGSMPILLVTPTDVPAATSAAIADLGIEQVVILGGTAAVGDDVAAQLEDETGNDAIRVAGVNRFGTAAEVGRFAEAEFDWAPTEILLASGLNFPDALAGGPLGGERQAPIVLLASWPEESAEYADEVSDTAEQATCLGGTAACAEEDLEAAVESLQTTDNDEPTGPAANATATNKPELVSASIVETRTAATQTGTRPSGTYIKYCFDEIVTGKPIVAASFFAYNSDGTRFVGSATDSDAARTFVSGVTADDTKCVEIIFDGLNTATSAASLTLATVDAGAVAGQASATTDQNIEGDAPLTPASSTTAAAGVTAAPDLVSVGNFRAGTTQDVTAVDFTFDQAAFVTGGGASGGFHLITTGGADLPCTASAVTSDLGGLAAPGGSGTTTITVNCTEPAAFTGPANLAATNIARGYVNASSVTATSGGTSPNPLESATVTAGGEPGPELTLILFSEDAVVGADVVGFVFDEPLAAGTGPSGIYLTSASFALYNTAGTERPIGAPGSGEICARSTDSNTAVRCLIADGALAGATFVGGNVRANAVTDTDGTPNPNTPSEIGVTPTAGPSTAAGRTDGPDLTGVTINTVPNPFGAAGYTATYTFDEDVADTGNTALLATDCPAAAAGANPPTPQNGNCATGENVIASLFHLYTADGIRLDCTSFAGGLGNDTAVLTNRSEDTDNTVTCTNFAVAGTDPSVANVTTPAATATQVSIAVVGTVEYGAADDETPAGGDTNPEGHAVATGSAGTPAS